MDDWRAVTLPAALGRAQRKIQQWRQEHRPRARLPDGLWCEAARLARAYGINRTARALRLDYYSLKRHAAVAPEPGERAPEQHSPKFLEILPGGLSPSRPEGPSLECMIEIEESGGAKMRIHLQGGDVPDVAALTRAFREGRE